MHGAGPYAIGGASRKTKPKGFDPNHARGEFLLHEGLWAEFDRKPGKIVETVGFVDFCTGHFEAMWPISRWLLKEVAPGA